MRKKRLFAAFLASALILSLSACGTAGSADDSAAESTAETAAESEQGSTEAGEDKGLALIRDAAAAIAENADESFGYDVAYKLAYDEELQSTPDHGWRTAGSEAEHKTAEYLSEVMTDIGLEDVEKVPISVDSWEYGGGSLTVADTDFSATPYPYATSGTDEAGITAEIVDVGTGTMDEYDGLNVQGKIVLVGVDQINEQWIDLYMDEAAVHGAAAIVSYPIGDEGYATLSDDDANVHDVCDTDVMPCVSISRNEANALQEAIADGKNKATLVIDSRLGIGEGTSYNVMGRIKGRNSEQAIVLSGHYDKYFWGFQDDSTAIGLICSIAKAMKDSGYEPQNDIYFIAHAAEEWGNSGTQSDYTTGAWEMINHARPDWQGKIIGMLNFELPAVDDGAELLEFQGVPEFGKLIKSFAESGIAPDVSEAYADGMADEIIPGAVMEDGISYRLAGVPYIVNVPGFKDGPEGWYQQRYHTFHDDSETYSAEVMTANIATYGALAVYIDRMPALELDLNSSADDMEAYLNAETAEIVGADTEAYAEGIKAMRDVAEAHNAKIAEVNEAYKKAVAGGASDEELDKLYAEGREVNACTLKAFRYVQDNFVNVANAGNVESFHSAYQNNVEMLGAVIDAIDAGELANDEDGVLDIAFMINDGAEYGKYYFSPEANKVVIDMLADPESQKNYGSGRGYEFADTKGATRSVLEKVMAEEEAPDLSAERGIYEEALERQKQLYAETLVKETEAMKNFADAF